MDSLDAVTFGLQTAPMAHFGNIIKALRNQARMTQEELAVATGITRSGIQAIERKADKTVRASTIIRLSMALRVPQSAIDGADKSTATIPLEMPAELAAYLEPMATENCQTINELVAEICRDWLKAQPRKKNRRHSPRS